MKKRQNKANKFYISYRELSEGVMNTFDYSYNHLESCLLLHDTKHYQSSIMFGIFSIEESFKGLTFMECIYKNNGIYKSEYEILQSHKGKIMKVINEVINAQTETRIGDNNKLSKKMSELNIKPMSKSEKNKFEKIYNNLPGLRSYCTYTDWDKSNQIWSNFNKQLNKKSSKNLSAIILCIASILLDNLQYMIISFIVDMHESKLHCNSYLTDPKLSFKILNDPKHQKNMEKIENTDKSDYVVKKFNAYCKSSNFTNFCKYMNNEFQGRLKTTSKTHQHIFDIMKEIKPFLKHP